MDTCVTILRLYFKRGHS